MSTKHKSWHLCFAPLIFAGLHNQSRLSTMLSCTIFVSFVILLSVLDRFFLVSEVPVDDVETQSANHKIEMILNCARHVFHFTHEQ